MNEQLENKYIELIEKAKEHSKNQIINFISGIYKVNPQAFENLWNKPIINEDEIDGLIPENLSPETRITISNRLFELVEDHLFESPAAFIPLGVQYISSFKNISKEEEDFIDNLSYIIVYDESVAKDAWVNGMRKIERGETKSTVQDMERQFIEHYSEVFSHERMHLNMDVLITDPIKDRDKEGQFVNGTALSEEEKLNHPFLSYTYQEHNEVFVDTISQLVENYEQGDSIQDCLYKFLEHRHKEIEKEGGNSLYDDLYDKSVLAMFVLFPEELTEWGIFGAYEDRRRNVLMEKIDEVFEKYPLSDSIETEEKEDNEIDEETRENLRKQEEDNKINEGIRAYLRKRQKEGNPITDRQKEMFEMLGIKEFGTQEIKKSVENSDIPLGLGFNVYDIIQNGLRTNENDKDI